MGGGRSSNATVTKSTIDPNVWNMVRANYGRALNLANAPFTPYTEPLVADPSKATLTGQKTLMGATKVGDKTLDFAINAARRSSGFKPINVTAQTGLGGLDAYMNPYIDNVVKAMMAELERSRQIAGVADAQKTSAASAWGGSRAGVQGALTNEAYDRTAAGILADLYSKGFDSATGLLTGDKSRLLEAAKSNQGAGLEGARINLGGASLLGQLSNEELQNYLTGGQAQLSVGAQQDALEQAKLNAAYQQYLREQQYPIDMQELLNRALGVVTGAQGTQQTTAVQPVDTLGGIGSLLGGAGLLGSVLFPPAAPAALAMSDARVKTDIETAGYDGKGRRWVDFRYLWDEPGTRRRGVIAQEVEKTDPGAVIDGPIFKSVDYAMLREAA